MKALWEKVFTIGERKKLPEGPGVYFFLDKKKNLLYIGKATALRDRVKSYYARAISETRGPKIVLLLEKVCFVAYQKTSSVLEALILESNLIKKYQPAYNTDAKDDKSYKHVVITEEQFPRVLIVRGRDFTERQKTVDSRRQVKYKYVFGPFPHGAQLREAMKIVRRLFPFRDKCQPAKSKQRTNNKSKIKPCFSAQIGLCPSVCTGMISAREYGKTINHIRLFFEGHKNKLVMKLKREMKCAAKQLAFERANEIKKTLFGLQHIQDIALIKDETRGMKHESGGARIEAYDVAHLGGKASVGAMVVIENNQLDKDEYRLFRLRKKHNGNDLTALEEVISRRLQHSEWRMPDIVVVDGSFLQLGVAEKLFAGRIGIHPLLVGVVKDERHQPKDIINLHSGFANMRTDILLANNEAHRFVIGYHRKRRGKEFLS